MLVAAFVWGLGGDRTSEAIASTSQSLQQLLLPYVEDLELSIFGLLDKAWLRVRLSATGHLPAHSVLPALESGAWTREAHLLQKEWDMMQAHQKPVFS